MATCEKKNVLPAENIGSSLCTAGFFSPVPKKCIDLDLSLLYILVIGTYSRFARKNKFLALGICFSQPSSSTGRRFAESGSSLQYYRRIVSFPQKISMKYVVNWIRLRICVRSRNTQPHLKKVDPGQSYHESATHGKIALAISHCFNDVNFAEPLRKLFLFFQENLRFRRLKGQERKKHNI